MIRLIYSSLACSEMSAQDISDILSVARQRNAESNVTGVLIYQNRRFLQVLEGEETDVTACFGRVSRDPRHAGIRLLARGPAKSRAFPKWAMEYEQPEDLDLFSRQYALTIQDIQDRLEAVADVNTPERPGITIMAMSHFLRQTTVEHSFVA